MELVCATALRRWSAKDTSDTDVSDVHPESWTMFLGRAVKYSVSTKEHRPQGHHEKGQSPRSVSVKSSVLLARRHLDAKLDGQKPRASDRKNTKKG